MIPESYIPYLVLVFTTYVIGAASPGPATLAIMSGSMRYGRANGIALAIGVTVGSFMWGISAALGLGSLMALYSELFIFVKIIGGMYLLWLAYKSLCSVRRAQTGFDVTFEIENQRKRHFFTRGLALHLTNPKAVLVWGAIITLGLPPQAPEHMALSIALTCSAIGMVILVSYALLFSTRKMVDFYGNARRVIETVLMLFFGFAGGKVLLDAISEMQLIEE